MRKNTAAPGAHLTFSPRSALARQMISIDVSPQELHQLVRALEAEAEHAAQFADQLGCADYLFRRVAVLREAAR